jgi:hypothetical protein
MNDDDTADVILTAKGLGIAIIKRVNESFISGWANRGS